MTGSDGLTKSMSSASHPFTILDFPSEAEERDAEWGDM